jgi:hypothetical protein
MTGRRRIAVITLTIGFPPRRIRAVLRATLAHPATGMKLPAPRAGASLLISIGCGSEVPGGSQVRARWCRGEMLTRSLEF